MNLRLISKLLYNTILSSALVAQAGYSNYTEFSAKIEELLTRGKRDSVKNDPLSEMMLASVIGGVLLLPRFDILSVLLLGCVVFVGYVQLFKVPMHGCLYASVICLVGVCGFLMKSFVLVLGFDTALISKIPVYAYMFASLVFYVFRCIDEQPQVVIQRDYFELAKYTLLTILIILL